MTMASILAFQVSPSFPKSIGYNRPGYGGRILCNLGGGMLDSDSVTVNVSPDIKEGEKLGSSIVGGNGLVGSIDGMKKRDNETNSEQLEVLYDDGFGSVSMKDYLDISKDMIKPDGGPPRWFSPVECGRPLKGSPLLLFLPGNMFFDIFKGIITHQILFNTLDLYIYGYT